MRGQMQLHSLYIFDYGASVSEWCVISIHPSVCVCVFHATVRECVYAVCDTYTFIRHTQPPTSSQDLPNHITGQIDLCVARPLVISDVIIPLAHKGLSYISTQLSFKHI